MKKIQFKFWVNTQFCWRKPYWAQKRTKKKRCRQAMDFGIIQSNLNTKARKEKQSNFQVILRTARAFFLPAPGRGPRKVLSWKLSRKTLDMKTKVIHKRLGKDKRACAGMQEHPYNHFRLCEHTLASNMELGIWRRQKSNCVDGEWKGGRKERKDVL